MTYLNFQQQKKFHSMTTANSEREKILGENFMVLIQDSFGFQNSEGNFPRKIEKNKAQKNSKITFLLPKS